MFATDRDLVTLEPGLMRDVGWSGQMLVRGVGTIAGSVLTLSPGPEADLQAAGVGPGHVALVAGTSYEVVEVLGPLSARVSRLRDLPGDPVRPASPVSNAAVTVTTFSPQIRVVHEQVLRMAGIEPSAPAGPGRPGAGAITNGPSLARLEALGALHLVFAAAAAPGGDLTPASWWSRASMYRERFAAERQRIVAEIDTDGDGSPDATRRLNMVQFVRA